MYGMIRHANANVPPPLRVLMGRIKPVHLRPKVLGLVDLAVGQGTVLAPLTHGSDVTHTVIGAKGQETVHG